MNFPEAFIHDMQRVGLQFESPWDLVNTRQSYRAAIPILLDWLERAENEVSAHERPKFREGLVRSLAVKEARGVAAPALLHEFRRDDTSWDYRGAVGNSLEVVADDGVFDEVVEIARNQAPLQGRLFQGEVVRRGSRFPARVAETRPRRASLSPGNEDCPSGSNAAKRRYPPGSGIEYRLVEQETDGYDERYTGAPGELSDSPGLGHSGIQLATLRPRNRTRQPAMDHVGMAITSSCGGTGCRYPARGASSLAPRYTLILRPRTSWER